MRLNIELGLESPGQNMSRTEQIQNTQIIDASPICLTVSLPAVCDDAGEVLPTLQRDDVIMLMRLFMSGILHSAVGLLQVGDAHASHFNIQTSLLC